MNKEHIFECTHEAITHLKERDPKLAAYIDLKGNLRRTMTPDLFESLVSSIISQQISGKAAVTVGNRLKTLLGNITPERILSADAADIQKCGMSMKKVSYMKSAAEAAANGTLPIEMIGSMTDKEMIDCLTSLPGIGVWTAEMLMIFSLGRTNVFSYNDFGIRKGLMRLHDIDKITKPLFEEYRALYSPHCTIASFYLWELASEQP